jgi:ABC-type taurine transport system substrate-binding protein
MPAALKQGRVDAIWANEPFLTGAKAEGARIIFSSFEEYDPKLTVAAYFTTKQYATDHADVVARFARAMAKSNLLAQSHPAETRAVLTSYTKLDAAAVANIAQGNSLSDGLYAFPFVHFQFSVPCQCRRTHAPRQPSKPRSDRNFPSGSNFCACNRLTYAPWG